MYRARRDRQAGRPAGRPADGQTDRHIYIHTHIYIPVIFGSLPFPESATTWRVQAHVAPICSSKTIDFQLLGQKPKPLGQPRFHPLCATVSACGGTPTRKGQLPTSSVPCSRCPHLGGGFLNAGALTNRIGCFMVIRNPPKILLVIMMAPILRERCWLWAFVSYDGLPLSACPAPEQY